MSLRLCFETRAPAGRIASSSTRSASLGEFWTQVDSSLAAVDALKTLGAPARGLPWTCRFVVISTFYFAYEIARYALSKRELRSRVNAHAPATTLRYRPKNSFIKQHGNIHISFLEPIMPGKNKDNFIKEIENKIYSEIKKFI